MVGAVEEQVRFQYYGNGSCNSFKLLSITLLIGSAMCSNVLSVLEPYASSYVAKSSGPLLQGSSLVGSKLVGI